MGNRVEQSGAVSFSWALSDDLPASAPLSSESHLFPAQLEKDAIQSGCFEPDGMIFHDRKFMTWGNDIVLPIVCGLAEGYPLSTESFSSRREKAAM